jgi:hypothetical protein
MVDETEKQITRKNVVHSRSQEATFRRITFDSMAGNPGTGPVQQRGFSSLVENDLKQSKSPSKVLARFLVPVF